MGKGRKGGRRPPAKGRPGGSSRSAGARPKAAGSGAAGSCSGSARSSSRPTRASRRDATRAARRRRQLVTRVIVIGAVVALLAGVAAIVGASRQKEQAAVDEVATGTCEYDEEFDGDAGTGRNHVGNPVYEVDPPAGGDHLSSAASRGRYTVASAPQDGQLVHALEHGFVILWHRPELTPADQTAVDQIADRYTRELLIVPRASLAGTVAVTAWHRRLLCEKVEPEAIGNFIENFRDRGPEKRHL